MLFDRGLTKVCQLYIVMFEYCRIRFVVFFLAPVAFQSVTSGYS